MGRADAERTFGITTKHVCQDVSYCEATLRDNLTGLLADHRTMLDYGLSFEVQQNAGDIKTAMTCVNLSLHSAQSCGTLPSCDRWGDMHTSKATFVSRRVAQNDVLAHDSRHSLPCATRVAAKSTQVGPTCSMRSEMNSMWIEPISYTRICQGTLDLDLSLGSSPDEPADAIALQMDGDRIWPPRALADDDDANAAERLVEKLNGILANVEPRIAQTNGVGVYMRAVKAVIDSSAPTRAQRQLLELGIGIFTRNPLAFHSVRKRALHTAMACHMSGRTGLGKQLERLSDFILVMQNTRSVQVKSF